MAGRVNGKIALVTGGGSGIGRATALVFAREGAKVVIADVVVSGGEETVRLIKAAGGEAVFIKADVSKAADVEALIKKTVDTYGRLDCAFNNAGIEGEIRQTAECSEENWDRTMAINLKGVWLCMKYEIPVMLKQDGSAYASPYTAAKHGVVGLTRALAVKLGTQGVTVNCICPGAIHTGLIAATPDKAKDTFARRRVPLKRYGEPEEVAHPWFMTG
jgi:NAD(P)-dependent dehydrogenase (short-subunit alcohol dehydrogenase family)